MHSVSAGLTAAMTLMPRFGNGFSGPPVFPSDTPSCSSSFCHFETLLPLVVSLLFTCVTLKKVSDLLD